MVKFSRLHGEKLVRIQHGPIDPPLAATYYDAQRVYFQIADYTGNDLYLKYAEAAERVYRDRYVAVHKGGVPGYWNFSHGLMSDFLRGGDEKSQQAVLLLSKNAAFARDSTPLISTRGEARSREAAYALMSYINAERVGAPRRERLAQLFEQCLGHIDQWFVQETSADWAPFMFGLTAEALIEYWNHVEQDERILSALTLGAEKTWEKAWIQREQAFFYRANEPGAAPDLNLLVAPVYAWVYLHTGDTKFRDWGDWVFVGGVRNAYLNGGKQFNQNYRWSFDYVRWRQKGVGQHSQQRPAQLDREGEQG